MENALLIAFGVALLGVSWACWSGRWRAWTGIAALPLAPITLLPAVGVLFVAMGAGELLRDPLRGVLYAATFVALAAGAVIWLWDPRWYGPDWYRSRESRGR